jgi:acyl-CoA synthetase (AMP-forming)/AMP-acid ligase II
MTTARTAVGRLPFIDSLSSFGARPAVVAGDQTFSYAELADRARDAGDQLSDGGSARRLVQLQPANDIEGLSLYLGALAGGHAVLVAPPAASAAADLATAYRPDVIVHGRSDGYRIEQRQAAQHELHDDLALLLSTSGTTGSPKLVRLSTQNLQSNAASVADSLAIRPDDRAITSLPLNYCYGLSVVHSHLLSGGCLVLTDDSVLDTTFWYDARRHGVTSFAGVPHTFDLLDRIGFADFELPQLRYVTQAGGRLAPDRVAHYCALGRARGWDFVVMYGQTEATARMAVLPADRALCSPAAAGFPVPGGSFRLEPVDDAEPGAGELVYSGPNVMLGYAHGPADLAAGRTVHELRTGDLARIGTDGLIEIIGRTSCFIKIMGLRVDLCRLETVLAERGITACAGGRDGQLDVLAEGDGLSLAAVRAAAAAASGLPLHAIRVAAAAALPRLPNGKLDRGRAAHLVRSACEAAAGSTGEAASRAEVAAVSALAAVVAEVLGRPVDPAASFVDLGGDSLTYVETAARLQTVLGALPDGWHRIPLVQLAARPAPARAHHNWLVTLDTTVLFRALAIIAIVGTHAGLFTVRGGAHLLLGIAGYNFARFGLADEGLREHLARAGRSLARIVVPSVAWISALAVLTGDYGLTTVLLVNAALGPDAWGPAWHYWFIEALVWIVVAVTALRCLPGVRRWQRKAPFGLAITLVLAGLIPRFHQIELWPGPALGTAPYIFWIFALGWAASAAASAPQRLLVSMLVLLSVPGFFGNGLRDVVVATGLLGLVWLPTVRVPQGAVSPLEMLTSASLFIYLVQWQVYPLFDQPWLALLASLFAGLAGWAAVNRIVRLTGRRRRSYV